MSESFVPNGIITLCTDFGLAEPYVGVMKGVVLKHYPRAQLIDLTHAIPAFEPQMAGMWLARCAEYFGHGTVHLAVVDPGVGTDRAMLLVEQGGQLFVAPDNGLLQPLLQRGLPTHCRRFVWADLAHLGINSPSRTFHGRDVFAPLVAALAAGTLLPHSLGEPVPRPSDPLVSSPTEGRVWWVDHYGNLLTDLPESALSAFANPAALIANRLIPMTTSYGFVAAGELLALVNAWRLIEIAQHGGNAATILQCGRGTTVKLVEHTTAVP